MSSTSPPADAAADPRTKAPALELAGVVKRFGAHTVLDGIDLALAPGEVHALLGENGAGKTTLVRIALGLVRADAGTLRCDGREVTIADPADAAALGIGMVHQHFTLAPGLTVAENLALADPPPFWTRRSLEAATAKTLSIHGFGAGSDHDPGSGSGLDPARRVATLSTGEKQRLEIAKALAVARRVLILDEPTAVLTPAETDALYAQLEQLRQRGLALLLITHRLDEVLAVAQRVTVLRNGKVALAAARADIDAAKLTRALFGSDEIGERDEQRVVAPRNESTPAAEVAVARALVGPRFGPLDLTLRAGECSVLFGIDGHGQGELIETLAGARRPTSGTLRIPRDALAYVGGDRHATGLALDLSLAENLALKRGALPRPWYRRAELAAAAEPLLARFDVRCDGPWQSARSLSGGNQQKVVLARELAHEPALILAENPTRGLDRRATLFVQEELRAAVARGAAALVATSDLDEALALAGPLFVIERGRIAPCRADRHAVADALAALAAGAAT